LSGEVGAGLLATIDDRGATLHAFPGGTVS
jgi:hypothetical protein